MLSIPQAQLDGLAQYKYASIDKSFITKYFMKVTAEAENKKVLTVTSTSPTGTLPSPCSRCGLRTPFVFFLLCSWADPLCFSIQAQPDHAHRLWVHPHQLFHHARVHARPGHACAQLGLSLVSFKSWFPHTEHSIPGHSCRFAIGLHLYQVLVPAFWNQ